MIFRNILLFACSTAVCFVVAKTIVAYSVVPLDQQQPLTASMQLASSITTVEYSDLQNAVDAVFPIENLGSGRVVVNPKESNCDCTVGKQAAIVIPPGQSSELRLSLSMKSLRDRERISFSLGTNDPTQPIVPVVIEITNRPPLFPPGADSVLEDIVVADKSDSSVLSQQ